VFIHGWTPHDATQSWGAEPGGAEAIAAELGVPFVEADFADADAPPGSAVTFRFRPSADGRGFGAWSESCPAGARFVEVELTLAPGQDGAAPRVRAFGFRDPL